MNTGRTVSTHHFLELCKLLPVLGAALRDSLILPRDYFLERTELVQDRVRLRSVTSLEGNVARLPHHAAVAERCFCRVIISYLIGVQ